MGLKKLRPITPAQRFRSVSDFKEITKSTPERSLVAPISKSGGRNQTGKMTMRQTGGGHKRRYRIVDFLRFKLGVPATVAAIEYDPNRTARIALLHYADGAKAYIIAPDTIQVGQKVVAGAGSEPAVGNCLPLKEIPLGSIIHNVELRPNGGGRIARSAGTFAQLMAREEGYAVVKLPSGEVRRIMDVCTATVGSVGNSEHINMQIGKAGRNRWLGKRPRVRGVAMNPVDHPMGGGEGKASGGQPRSRKGLYAKGKKTRNRNKVSNKFIISRRKS